MTARKLLSGEIALIRKLLEFGQREDLCEGLEDALVAPMGDGGMGSLLFVTLGNIPRKFGTVVATAEALDSDNVEVSYSLNLDTAGNIYELDAWKVDFSPVIALPDAAKLQK